MRHSNTRSGGLEVHKDSIAVADVANEHDAEVIDLGPMGTRQADLDHRLRKMPSKATPLGFVQEAGPGGSWLQRDLTPKGHGCWVVAPSLLPKKAGDRVNPDRRDAVHLARLRRSGALTPGDVPAVAAEALGDLSRARDETLHALKTATFRLPACLLRHDRRQTGRAPWGPAHRRWLSEVVGPTPAQPSVFHAEVRAVTEPTARLQRLDQARHAQVTAGRLCPGVDALQALRGVPLTGAVTTVAELGDLPRVDHPRPLRPYVGLTPSEYARGERRPQGGITKTGKTQARRALVDGAGADRDPAHVSRHLPLRLETLPQPIPDTRWKAQVRRCQRDRPLSARGKHPPPVVVALARELSACMWAMAQQVPVTASRRRLQGPCIEPPTGFAGQRPTSIGSGAAPVWGHPRWREEVQNPRASIEAGT